AVRKSLSDQSRIIRLPFHMVEATYRVKEVRKQLYSENGKHTDKEKIVEATRFLMKRLSVVMLTPKAQRSLDQKIGFNQNLKPSGSLRGCFTYQVVLPRGGGPLVTRSRGDLDYPKVALVQAAPRMMHPNFPKLEQASH
ncbi:hypothetical protein HAX54_034148, partial [Datura stramonium]|nr:hypothetical protein [Datura stramonium]